MRSARLTGALPAGVSPHIVSRLNREFTAIAQSPGISNRLEGLGMTAIRSTPEGCRDYMRSELEKWGQVVRASGAKIQ